MSILVTGSNGFVGKYLFNQIPDAVGVDIIGSEKTQILDICDFRKLQLFLIQHNVETIVHLAGAQYSRKIFFLRRKSYFMKNVEMAESISRAVSGTRVQSIVYLSTDMVYGKNIVSPVSETQICEPLGPYGSSKLQAEAVLSKIPDICLTVLRPRIIVGAGRRGTIEQLANWLKKGFPIPILGNGKSRYQFLSVNDCVSAILAVIRQGTSGTFNLGSDSPPNLDVLFAKTMQSLNLQNKTIHLPAKLTCQVLTILDFLNLSPLAREQFAIASLDYVLDTSKFKSSFNWQPVYSDEQMLVTALSRL